MKSSKKKALTVTLGAILMVVTIGITYAFITTTLTGTKKVTLTAGTLSLVLSEGNAITISDALPMYDEVGMIQDKAFTFSLANNTSVSTDYTLKLQKIASASELSEDIVKYYLTKDGVGEPKLLSTLTDGVIDTGIIEGNDTIEYILRMWIDSSVTTNEAISGKSLSYMLKIEASQADGQPSIPTTVTFAGITKEVNESPDGLFNYTSEGCIVDVMTQEKICPGEATNGIYAMEDDDSLSYFYRGEVDNLVKFGSYTKDYYVYRYSDYEFSSLEACKYYTSSCTEDNKVLKYAASDNVPMYWRIIRINGDGTIRMIYAGTTPDATREDTGIGLSRYNEEYDDPKYAGYTYDKTTTEVDSDAKEEIDNWYSNVFEGTVYDSQIAPSKFCSDSSGYEDDAMGALLLGVDRIYSFSSIRRNFANLYGRGNASPTFKCTKETDENFGGSYNLKAGLITYDEIMAAGGQITQNNSYYLYNGTKGNDDGWYFWSMTPAVFDGDGAGVGDVYGNGGALFYGVDDVGGLLRPVINLRSDITFKSGTDGSTTAPYELVE